MNKKYIALVFLILSNGVFAQQNAECIKLLKQALNKMNNPVQKTGAGHIYYCSYTLKTVMDDSLQKPTSSSDVTMEMGAKVFKYSSKEINIVQDQKDVLTIIPHKKIIYLSSVIPNINKENQFKILMKMQDSLLKYSTVKECVDLTNNKLRKIVLEVNEKKRKQFKVKNITFTINTERNEIVGLITKYDAAYSPINRVEINYHDLDYNRTDQKLDEITATSAIYSPAHVILPQFANYKIIDVRNKKK